MLRKRKSTSSSNKKCNIIDSLNRRRMAHITEQILSYLDYPCLRKAESVCILWREIIHDGKLWRKLLARNMLSKPDWRKMKHILQTRNPESFPVDNHPDFHQQTCWKMGEALEELLDNWKTGTHTDNECVLGSTCGFLFLDGNVFDMNEHCIVKGQLDGRIIVRNRWTFEVEYVIPMPPEYSEDASVVTSLRFNDKFIVAMFWEYRGTCIWDSKTKQLLQILDDGYVIDGEDNTHAVHYCECSNNIRLHENMLVCCGSTETSSLVVTLRQLTGDMPVIYRKMINGPAKLVDMALDDTFLIVFFMSNAPLARSNEVANYNIEIRSTCSFEPLKLIQFKSFRHCYFDYYNGIIATGLIGNKIRLWVAKTGECVRSISYDNSLSAVRLVSNLFLVSCSVNGTVNYWDLVSLLTADAKTSETKTISAPSSPYAKSCKVHVVGMRADEYQIAMILCYNYQTSLYLRTMDFLGGSFTEKKTRKSRKRRLTGL